MLASKRPLHRVCLVGLLAILAAAQLAAGSGPTGAGFTAPEVNSGFRADRLLVRFKARAPAAERRAAEARAGVAGRRSLSRIRGLEILEIPRGRPASAAIAALQASGLYESVERDPIVRALKTAPNDPDFPYQWSLNNSGQAGGVAGSDISAESAWDIQKSASGVIVAVIDSGIRLTHQDLAPNLWTNPNPGAGAYTADIHGINASIPISEPGNGNPDDDLTHGSMVAGIIGAAGNNGTGICGVAWSVQLMALKFISSDGFGSVSGEIECIDYALSHGATIINGSFGGDTATQAEFDAIQQAGQAGVIFVAAAGNSSKNVDLGYVYPAGYPLDNIVSVAATTTSDSLSSYSNFGPGMVDLAAPGDTILSTMNRSDTSVGYGSGTSFAAPHVAGALALLKSRFPGDSYHQTINRLLASVDPLPGLLGRVQTGGRLDLAAALLTNASRPFNDDFEHRAVLSGSFVRTRGSNVGATLQPSESEPSSIGGTGVGSSLWWTWTPPETGTYYIDTAASSFDTVLAVYDGTTLPGLHLEQYNDDASAGVTTSQLVVYGTAGTPLQIQVSGKGGATGLVSLEIAEVPPNDRVSAAQVLTGSAVQVNGRTLHATSDPGEPNPTGASAGHSVWYSWTAPASGSVQVAAYSNSIHPITAVYTGSPPSALSLAGSGRGGSGSPSLATVSFTAHSGTAYTFQVDDSDASGGNFTLTLNSCAWQFVAGGAVSSAPCVGADGSVYFGSDDGNVYALNSDGSLRWTHATGGPIDLASAAYSLGSVYIGSTDGSLYALNASSGALLWKFNAATPISTTPAVGVDGTVYFRDDLNLYAVSGSGQLKWSYPLSGGTLCSPVITSPATGGIILVGAAKGQFLALTPAGAVLGSYTADSDIQTTPATDGVEIYFSTVNGTIYYLRLNSAVSNELQEYGMWTPSSGDFFSSPLVLAGGYLYAAGESGKIYQLTEATLTLVSSYTAPAGFSVASPAVASDGTLYLAGSDFNLYAVTHTGSLYGSSAVASASMDILSSPVLANGNVYFGCDDGRLFALRTGEKPASGWPMYRQNASLTGVDGGMNIIIDTQPSDTYFRPNLDYVAVFVYVEGIGPFSYQWYHNGAAIPGATANVYRVNTGTLSDAGSYYVAISNPLGVVNSASANAVALSTSTIITSQPQGRNANAGDSVTLSVAATGPAVVYQWYRNGVAIPGATGPTLEIDNIASAQAGSYTVDAANLVGTTRVNDWMSDAATVNVAYSAHLINLSARASVATGGGVLIGGFVIGGAGSKQVLLRGVGPGLAATFGLGGVLAAPQLTLYDNSAPPGPYPIVSAQAWGAALAPGSSPVLVAPRAASPAVMSSVGAFSLATGSTDSAMQAAPPAGAYTAQISGIGGTSGVALAEIYDAGTPDFTAMLLNLSARAAVGTGVNILIGGFGITGSTSDTILIRAVGPGLSSTFGLQGTLGTPQLILFDGNPLGPQPIATNTGWGNSPVPGTSSVSAGILPASSAVMASVGAFSLVPGSADCAMLVTLPPGSYTAEVAGVGGSTGIALVEIYEVR